MLRLDILTTEDLDLIHNSAIEILEKTGVVIEDDKVLNLYDKAGAEVIKKEKIVKIPRHLVKEALKKVPKHVTLYSRDRKTKLELGSNGGQYFTTGGAVPFVLDHRTGERRDATTRDTINQIRLIDALKNIESIETSPGIWPLDVPAYLRDVHVSMLTFENTTKHYGLETVGPAEAHEYCIRMAEIVAGGEEELRKYPIIHASAEPIGPLVWDEHALRNMWVYAKHGLLVDIACIAITGLTSPTTIIGTLVHGNAGFLSGLVTAQLLNPGTPVGRIFSGVMTDLRTCKATMGSVEYSLLEMAGGQLGRYYGLPSMGIGGISDTNSIDVQAGYETALTSLLSALGGVNRIQSALLATATMTSLVKMVIDDEIFDMVKYALRGIHVSKDKIPMDLIHEVGPRGNFMGNRKVLEFTRKYLRTEHYVPSLSLRVDWDLWTKMRRKTVLDIAREKVETILKTHEPEPLPADVRKDLKRIYEEAKKKLAHGSK